MYVEIIGLFFLQALNILQCPIFIMLDIFLIHICINFYIPLVYLMLFYSYIIFYNLNDLNLTYNLEELII